MTDARVFELDSRPAHLAMLRLLALRCGWCGHRQFSLRYFGPKFSAQAAGGASWTRTGYSYLLREAMD